MPQQSHQTFREVSIVCHRPEGETVAGNNHRLAPAHAGDCGEGFGPAIQRQRHNGVTVGKGRTNNRYGERLFAQSVLQSVFASDLVSRVLPEWIHDGRGLRYKIVRKRFLINARRTDENKLAGASAKQLQALFNFRWSEGNEIHHGIPMLIAQGSGGGARVVDVGDNLLSTAQGIALSAIQNGKLNSPSQGQL